MAYDDFEMFTPLATADVEDQEPVTMYYVESGTGNRLTQPTRSRADARRDAARLRERLIGCTVDGDETIDNWLVEDFGVR